MQYPNASPLGYSIRFRIKRSRVGIVTTSANSIVSDETPAGVTCRCAKSIISFIFGRLFLSGSMCIVLSANAHAFS
jgi:hypothetical protein